MPQSENGHAAFLRAVFNEIFALDDGAIVTSSTIGWLPDVVWDGIGSRDATTARAIVDLCRAHRVVDETYALTLSKLRENWDALRPDRRANLITLIRSYHLEGNFESYMLSLSPTDEEALLVRWDAADILFAQEKQAVFNRATIDDKGRRNLLSLGKFSEVIEILLKLLAHKADYDVSAVILGAPTHVGRYLTEVAGRCDSEYLGYLVELRALYTGFLLDVHPDLYGPGGTHRLSLPANVEAHLESFKTRFEVLKKGISAAVQSRDIFERMVSFTRDHPRSIAAKETINIMRTINNNGPSVYVEQGNAQNFSQVQNNGSIPMKNVDLKQLADELELVTAEAKKRAKSVEELRTVVSLAEATESAQKGDSSTTGEKLGAVGKWVFDIAKELGASVIAKLIGANMGVS
jgi:hypothetical protein